MRFSPKKDQYNFLWSFVPKLLFVFMKIAKSDALPNKHFVCARNVRKAIFPHHTKLLRFRPHTWDQGHFHKVLGQSLFKTQISLEMMTYYWLSLAPNANKDQFFFQKNIPAKYLKLISKTPKGIFLLRTYWTIAADFKPPEVLLQLALIMKMRHSIREWNRMTGLNFSQFLIKKDDVS